MNPFSRFGGLRKSSSGGPGPASGIPLMIYGTPTTEALNGVAYSFQPRTTYAYGNTLTWAASLPSWASINSSTGVVIGTTETGETDVSITVTSSNGDTDTLTFHLVIIAAAPANNAPTISGTPQTSVEEGASYYCVFYAADADGDDLTFSIENKPAWMELIQTFDSPGWALCTLSGTAPAVEADTPLAAITISVLDGTDTTAGTPFVVTITDTTTPPVNSRPTISGTPATTAVVGQLYSFTPVLADPDLPLDTLVCSATGLPSWLTMPDTSTGVTTGTPVTAAGAVAIELQVYDGTEYAVTPISFNLTVTAPTSKYAAGHFAALKGFESLPTGHSLPPLTGSLRDPTVHFQKTFWQGFFMRWDWRGLEPTKNNYVLMTGQNSIQAWLDVLASLTTATYVPKLVPIVVVKAFNSDNRNNPLPDYMVDFTVPYLTSATKKTLQRWKYNTGDPNDPTDRLIALCDAIGDAFDTHPNFGGIAFQETAIGVTAANLTAGGYTAAAYIEAITLLNVGAKAAMPLSEVYCFNNFIENTPGASDGNTNLRALWADTRNQTNNIIMGCPDIIPNRVSLTRALYPLFDTWKNQYRTFASNQNDSGQALKDDGVTYYTADEMWQFAKDDLSCEIVVTNAEFPVAAISAAWPNGPTWGNVASPGDGGFEYVAKAHRTWTPGSLTLINENFMGTAAATINGKVSPTGSIACALSGTGGIVIASNLHSAVVTDTTMAARATWTMPSVARTFEWSFKNPYTGTKTASRIIQFFRRVSANNEWRLRVVATFSAGTVTAATLQLGFLNGTSTFVKAIADVVLANTVPTADTFYKITDDGANISVWVDGVLVMAVTDASCTAYSGQSSTLHAAGLDVGFIQGADSLMTLNSFAAATP